MMDLYDFVDFLGDAGVVQVLIPFILIFTIVFATLQKTKILGEGKKNFNAIISFAIAMSPIFAHYKGIEILGFDVVDLINSSLPQVSLVVVVLIMFLVVLSVLGLSFMGSEHKGLSHIISGGAAITVLYIFGTTAGWIPPIDQLKILFDSEFTQTILIILIFYLILKFITGSSSDQDDAVTISDDKSYKKAKKQFNSVKGLKHKSKFLEGESDRLTSKITSAQNAGNTSEANRLTTKKSKVDDEKTRIDGLISNYENLKQPIKDYADKKDKIWRDNVYKMN